MGQADAVLQPPPDASMRGRVDVVIPVRNGAQTIVQTLAGVLGQTTQPRSIIVVDDGSSDGTAALVTSLGSSLIELIVTPPVGVSHARNTGIRASRAEFVAFLDADDRWHPDKLRFQLQVFAAKPNIAVVYCGHAFINPSGEIVRTKIPKLRGRVFDKLLAGDVAGNSSSIVVRRSALLDVGGYDESLKFGEDLDLYLRLACQFEFDFAGDVLTYVVLNSQSVMRGSRRMQTGAEILLQYILVYDKWYRENGMPYRRAQEFRKKIVFAAVRRRYGWRWMLQMRAQMQQRAPMSARRIWPNHAVFAFWIALATLIYPFRVLARNCVRPLR